MVPQVLHSALFCEAGLQHKVLLAEVIHQVMAVTVMESEVFYSKNQHEDRTS